ncbi:Thylakoid lumenal protein TL20.3, chloroplastic [Linum grandiflorum]
MAFTSISTLLPMKSIYISVPFLKSPQRHRFQLSATARHQEEEQFHSSSSGNWKAMASAALAAAAVINGSFQVAPAVAELNKYEAATRGEFGIGSAAQFGSADLKKAVHVNENFRRANFTSADMRESDFSGSTFNGAYMEKAVAYKANFTGSERS